MRGRDYVSGEDVQWLAPYVFTHRLGSGPGLEDASEIVAECLKNPIETLSQSTLRP